MAASNEAARTFLEAHVARLSPLLRAANLAGWEAATSGEEEAVLRSAEARAKLRHMYSDAGSAARVRALLADTNELDPLLRRQLVLLDHAYTANLLPAEVIEEVSRREAALEQTFYNFRAELDGRRLSDNEVLEILSEERDSARRRSAWEASKRIGEQVAGPLLELVRVRNEAARTLGFADHYAMELKLQEIEEEQLFATLDRFEARTTPAFARLRSELDAELSTRFGVPPEQLRPWHWADLFGQEPPTAGGVDLDDAFAGRDPVAVARQYFVDIGLPVDRILDRSDLYERPGKDQHAFCIDIDREGDVRILCNMRDNEKWMTTLLHELGHAIYDEYIPRSLPFLLRTPAHTLSTESIAMLLGRLTREPEWLRGSADLSLTDQESQEVLRRLRASMLIAARWILVMVHFERALYRGPERSDLNTLWWDLVERFQMVQRPEGRDAPDWASKIHLSLAPVYYHNYLLGELMASQLESAFEAPTARTSPAVGEFLREQVFQRGASLHWDDLLVEATGGRLTPDHFIRQFVGEEEAARI
jgi:peptidyl-dipeptidase A